MLCRALLSYHFGIGIGSFAIDPKVGGLVPNIRARLWRTRRFLHHLLENSVSIPGTIWGNSKMMRLLIAAGVTAALLVSCGGEDDDEMPVAEWAATICAIANDANAALDTDGIDPNTLEFEARRDRASQLSEQQAEAMAGAASAMEDISPPGGARDYHEAITAQYQTLADVWREQAPRFTEAESVTDIEALNAEANIRFQETTAEVARGAEDLSDEATAAIRGITRCALVS